jgi:Spy/CpxP family protein refolding chaperone
MLNRSKAWALGLLTATLLTGLLAGAGAERLLDAREGSRRGRRPGYVERLTADLNLTMAQQDSVRAILDRTRPAMEALWRSVRPSYDSLRTAMQNDISSVLDSEQRASYQQLIEKWDRRRNGDRSRDRGGSKDSGRSKTGDEKNDAKH